MAPNPTFAVLTNFDVDYEVGFLCAAVNEAYCRRWGHRFLPCILTKDAMARICEGRHFAWAKLALFTWLLTPERSAPAARAVFEAWLGEARRAELLAGVEYLVWIDGDAMALDHAVPLARFVQGPARKKALVVAEDMSWADWVNTGVFLVRVDSPWARDLWWEAWSCAHNRFHQAPFWDQSGVCQALARRGEFMPDVLGAHPTGMKPSESPWFSWQGGRMRKETHNLHVVDMASLQFANPLHAQFVLHLCGYSDKLALCRKVIAGGALRGVRSASVADEVQRGPGRAGLVGNQWNAAWSAVREAVEASRPFPWGWWPVVALASGSKDVEREEEGAEEVVLRWLKKDAEEPLVVAASAPSGWSLRSLRENYGACMVPIDDCAPLRMNDKPQAGTFPSRSMRAPLWKVCDYLQGLPPPCHPVLGQLDHRRQWRTARWQPWAGVGSQAEVPPLPQNGDLAPLWIAAGEATFLNDSIVHLAPPGARLRLHQPYANRGLHTAIWQLEGEVEYVLLGPKALPQPPDAGPPLYDASQSPHDPWEDSKALPPQRRALLRAGEVLLLPAGWWVASIALSPALAVWLPWLHGSHRQEYQALRSCHANAAEAFSRSGSPHSGLNQLGTLGTSGQAQWWKETLNSGQSSGQAPAQGPFCAVAHVEVYTADGRGLRSSRLPPCPRPELIPVGFGSQVDREPLGQALRSMAVGELARVVVPASGEGASPAVFKLELLAALAPEAKAPLDEPALEGGWTWFGDPENWLGAPRGHKPVDQVEAARQRERREAEGHLPAATASARAAEAKPRPPAAAATAGATETGDRHPAATANARVVEAEARPPAETATARAVEARGDLPAETARATETTTTAAAPPARASAALARARRLWPAVATVAARRRHRWKLVRHTFFIPEEVD